MIVVRMTAAHQSALMELITEFIRCDRGHSELFQDRSTMPATSTTPQELLRLVSNGQNVELPQ